MASAAGRRAKENPLRGGFKDFTETAGIVGKRLV